jgi:hypothetical protein
MAGNPRAVIVGDYEIRGVAASEAGALKPRNQPLRISVLLAGPVLRSRSIVVPPGPVIQRSSLDLHAARAVAAAFDGCGPA